MGIQSLLIIDIFKLLVMQRTKRTVMVNRSVVPLNQQFTPLAYTKQTVRLLKCRAVSNLNAGPFLEGLAYAFSIIDN